MSPAGRPPISGERKNDQVRVLVTAAEKAALDAAATAAGKQTATWVREIALAAAAEIAASQAKPAGKKKAAKKKS